MRWTGSNKDSKRSVTQAFNQLAATSSAGRRKFATPHCVMGLVSIVLLHGLTQAATTDADLSLDDNTAHSPRIRFIDADDKELILQKLDSGEAILVNNEGKLCFKPSNDEDDFLCFETLDNLPALLWEGITATNAPGIRVNAAGQLEYRDEDAAAWVPFDNFGSGTNLADGSVAEDKLVPVLIFDDGDLLDLSGINASSASEGLILPQNTDTSTATAEGQISWDTDNDTLLIGTGSAQIILGSKDGGVTQVGDAAGPTAFTGANDGNALTFEGGATDDANDLTLVAADAASPVTITIPATTGTLALASELPASATDSTPGLVELADTAEAAAGAVTDRAVTPAGVAAYVDAQSFSAGDISAVGDVVSGEAFTATDGNDGTTLYFEGTTADANEVAVTTADPTADVTVTLPAADTTLVGTNTTDTLTNKTLASPVLDTSVSGTAVLDEDDLASDSDTQLATQQSIKAYVDSSVSGLGSGDLTEVGDATGPTAFTGAGDGSQLVFEGATNDANDLTLTAADPTSAVTVTIPAATGTLALTSELPSAATTTGAGLVELADSTEAAAGSNDTLAATPAGVKAYVDAQGFGTGSGDVTDVGDAAGPTAFTGDNDGNSLTFEGATDDANDLTLTAADAATDVTVTIPATDGTLALTSDLPGAASHTVAGTVELATDAETAAGSDDARAVTPASLASQNYITAASTDTLTNKALADSSTVLQDDADTTKRATFQVSGVATGATRMLAVPDKDGTLALTSDLPGTATAGGAGLVELADNAEAAAGSNNTLAVTPAGVRAYVDAQGFGTGSGDVTEVGDADGPTAFTGDNDGNQLVFEGVTDDDNEVTLTVADPGSDVTVTIPATTDTLVGRATVDTLTNKTLTSPALNSSVSGTAVLDEDSMASDSDTRLATQQSIKAYVDNSVSGLGSGDLTEVGDADGPTAFTGDNDGNQLVFEGDTDDGNDVTLVAADGSADVTVTIPAADGTLALTSELPTSASSDAEGLVELATATEASSGTDTSRAVTPAGVKAYVDAQGFGSGDGDVTAVGDVATGAAFTATDSTIDSDGTTLHFEGDTNDAFEVALTSENPTADVTVTLPAATDTLVGRDTTDTLTNKALTDSSTVLQDETDATKQATFEVAGVAAGATRTLAVPDKDGTLALTSDLPGAASEASAGVVQLATTGEATSGTASDRAVTPAGVAAYVEDQGFGTGDGDVTDVGNADGPTAFTGDNDGNRLTFEGDTDDDNDVTLVAADGSAAVTVTIPATDGTLALTSELPTSASSDTEGLVEFADTTEAQTGTATDRAVTPAGVKAYVDAQGFGTGSGDVTAVGDATGPTAFTGDNDGNQLTFEGTVNDLNDVTLVAADGAAAATVTIPATTGTLALTSELPESATDTAEGLVELATDTETADGSDATRAVTPASLAAQNYLTATNTVLQDDNDTTKQVAFEMAGVATETTRTLSVPDKDGTIALTSDLSGLGSGDVTDVGDATGPTAFTGDNDGNRLTFEGATNDANDLTLQAADPAAPITVTIPAASGTIALTSDLPGAASDTLAGTVELATDAETAAGSDATRAVTPASLASQNYITATSADTLANKALADSSTVLQDDADTTKEVAFEVSGVATGTTRTLAVPDKDGTLALTSELPVTATTTGAGLVELADSAEAAAGSNDALAVTPAGVKAYVDGQGFGTGSGDLTAVGDATGPTAFTETSGNDGTILYFEGATADANEVALTSADPVADVTVTIPATNGTLALTSELPDSASVDTEGLVELATTTEATNGTDTSRAVTPAGVKAYVDVQGFGSGDGDVTAVGDATGPTAFTGDDDGNQLVFEGATNDANDLTLTAADAASAVTVTIPATTGTLALTSDLPGTASESIPGVVQLATAAEATTGSATDRAVTPAGVKAYVEDQGFGTGDGDVTAVGDITNGNAFTETSGNDGTTLYFEGATPDDKEVALTSADPTTDVTVTLPAANTTLVGRDTTDTLTNKTLTSPTINGTDITLDDGDLVDMSSVGASSTTEGLILPQAADVSEATAEGQISWDTDDNTLYVGDDTDVVAVSNPFGDAIDSSDITDGTVTSTDIADGGIATADIDDDAITEDKLASNLAFDDGDVLNLSAIAPSAATTEGLILPQSADVSEARTEGQIAWDTDGDTLYVGDGTTAIAISNPFGTAIDSGEITDGTIAAEDLSSMSATDGQVLKWNSASDAWQASDDSNSQVTVINDLTTGGTADALSAEQGKTLDANKLETTASFGGDVSGSYDDLQLAAGAVTTTEIADATIATADIAEAAVTEDKLAASLAFGDSDLINLSAINASSTTEGLILPQANDVSEAKAEGQIAWDDDDDTLYVGDGASAVAVSNPFGDAIDSSEIANGTISSSDIAANAVTTTEIADATIAAADLSSMSATDGQVLKWNNASGAWQASDDSNSQVTVVNDLTTGGTTDALSAEQGKTLDANKLEITASFGGDVSGSYDDLQLAAGAVTTTEIADTTIATADIAEAAVTEDKLAASLAFDDGDVLDLSAIVPSTNTTEGLILPQAADVSAAKFEGQISWDTDDNTLYVGNGASPTAISSQTYVDNAISNVTLDSAYDGGRTLAVDAGAVQLTGSNASDETLEISNSGNGGALLVENTGTGHSFEVNDEASDTTPFVIDDSGNVGIGTSSPANHLEVAGQSPSLKLGTTGDWQAAIINLSGNRSSGSAGALGRIESYNNRSIDYVPVAGINFYTGGSGMESGEIAFFTKEHTDDELTEAMRIDESGDISVPHWNVTQIFNNQTGGLPLTSGSFSTNGGTLIVFAAGSGSRSGSGIIGMSVEINNTEVGQVKTYTSDTSSSKPFVANAIVVPDIGEGSYTVTLTALNDTTTNGNDFFNVTVYELPY